MRITIINGPNLNLLGKREPDVYGSRSFEDFFEELQKDYPKVEFSYYQSNVEGEIVNKLQEAGFDHDYILLNAGGYTHTSVAIADAVAAIKTPVIEIHISNPCAREEFRHESLLSSKCMGVLAGFGLDSYRLAVEYITKK